VLCISAKNGINLDDWLYEVTTRDDAGTHIADVNYDTYAEGESVLGWYNASFELQGDGIDWKLFLSSLLDALAEQFKKDKAPVGHVKIMLQDSTQYMIVNHTGTSKTIRGNIDDKKARMTINARVQMSHEDMENDVTDAMSSICNNIIHYEVITLKCLSPGRPNPTYCYARIV
jgi:hypothetical protein